MILDLVYTIKSFYISNQVKLKPTYLVLSLDANGLDIKGFCHSVNILTFINDEDNV